MLMPFSPYMLRAEHIAPPRAGATPLTGQAIANFAKKLFTAYPDMSLEIISLGDTGGGLVASQWVLHGTHTGPYSDGTRLPVVPLPFTGLPSLGLRAIRFARRPPTATGRR